MVEIIFFYKSLGISTSPLYLDRFINRPTTTQIKAAIQALEKITIYQD
jgi:hypothetical protein